MKKILKFLINNKTKAKVLFILKSIMQVFKTFSEKTKKSKKIQFIQRRKEKLYLLLK